MRKSTKSNISQDRAMYLEKQYVGIDSTAFRTGDAYIRFLDLYDKIIVSMVAHSKLIACNPIDDEQYWNEIWNSAAPERNKYLGFCSTQYIMTVGFDSAFKNNYYNEFLKLRSKCTNNANYHAGKFDGIWNATCDKITLKSKNGILCSDLTEIKITIRDSQISGTARDSQERVYEISGYVESSGKITGALGIGGNTVVGITGYLTENSGKGTYKTINGCSGTWSTSR